MCTKSKLSGSDSVHLAQSDSVNEQRQGTYYLSQVYDPLLTRPTSGDYQNRRVDQVPSF